MFTVKLIRGNVTKLVAAESISIFPSGKPSNKEDLEVNGETARPIPSATNAVREIALVTNGHEQRLFVGQEGAVCIYGTVELWDCAYIENAHGATTERVDAY